MARMWELEDFGEEEEAHEEAAEEVGGDVDLDAEDRGGPVRLARHPPGTWTVVSTEWFYVTQTDGWIDIKIWIKHPLRGRDPGMGTWLIPKTPYGHMCTGSMPKTALARCVFCLCGRAGGLAGRDGLRRRSPAGAKLIGCRRRWRRTF